MSKSPDAYHDALLDAAEDESTEPVSGLAVVGRIFFGILVFGGGIIGGLVLAIIGVYHLVFWTLSHTS